MDISVMLYNFHTVVLFICIFNVSLLCLIYIVIFMYKSALYPLEKALYKCHNVCMYVCIVVVVVVVVVKVSSIKIVTVIVIITKFILV